LERSADLTPVSADDLQRVRECLEAIAIDAKKAINGHDALCLLGVIQHRIREELERLAKAVG